MIIFMMNKNICNSIFVLFLRILFSTKITVKNKIEVEKYVFSGRSPKTLYFQSLDFNKQAFML